jgi:hypothetical protein
MKKGGANHAKVSTCYGVGGRTYGKGRASAWYARLFLTFALTLVKDFWGEA